MPDNRLRGTSGKAPRKTPQHAPANRSGGGARVPPRADRGDGEAAVQARIAALDEPSRSILTRLHPLIMKHAKTLQPVVRYGFAIYMRGNTMLLLAAPRKTYVTFSYTKDAGINAKPIELTSVDQIHESQVAEMVRRLEE
ncbi:MAG TPA: DUF1801 domain-containing protein [Thermoplasmata archaeon]|nr:DUF1801 domain-containing protein [Thermoplasmata archaeon]